MRRRGSHSANMLKPTVAVIQGEQQQQEQSDSMNRRTSLPDFRQGMTNGSYLNHHLPQAPALQGQNNQSVAPPPLNNINMQWQHPPRQTSIQQPHTRHSYSFASSMDLISSNTTSTSNGNATFHPLQNNALFKSSSHHTSHTAVAGDLLTMSRRALDPPLPNQINTVTKKRSSTEADVSPGNPGLFNCTSMNRSNSTGGQQTTHLGVSQQHQTSAIVGGFMPNPHATSYFSGHGSASYVSSSTVGTVGDTDDSYQEHRTIRQCRRSDSFEMMEDS